MGEAVVPIVILIVRPFVDRPKTITIKITITIRNFHCLPPAEGLLARRGPEEAVSIRRVFPAHLSRLWYGQHPHPVPLPEGEDSPKSGEFGRETCV